MNLWIKKSVQSLEQEVAEKKHALLRSLTSVHLTAIGIGAIIGAGLFVLTGTAAAEYAGPAILFSFLIGGVISVFAALCYAEFAALIPVSGSAYSYAYVALGEFPAWIIGWGLTLQYLLSACTVSVGWSSYLLSALGDFGIFIPESLAKSTLMYDVQSGWKLSGSFMNLPAILIIILMGLLIAFSTKAMARFNTVMVVIKLAVVLLFIGCGISFVNWSNFVPFVPENTGVFGEFGWSGVFRGAGVVFFAFIGFDSLSTLTQEAKSPQKDMPRGMLGSLGISTFCHIAMAIVLIGLVPYKLLDVASPIAVAIDVLGPSFLWLRFFIKIAILAGLSSAILIMLLGQTRICYTMAHDGLLPEKLGKINERHHNPLFTTFVITMMGATIAGIFPVLIIGQLVVMATLIAFAIVSLGVLILRYTQPALHRPFKTPLFPYIPSLGVLTCLLQICFLPLVTWLQFLGWTFLGLIFYFTYSMKRSKVRLK